MVCRVGFTHSELRRTNAAVSKVERLQRALDALGEDQRSKRSRKLSRRLRRLHENDPLRNWSKSARISSSAPPDVSTSWKRSWSQRQDCCSVGEVERTTGNNASCGPVAGCSPSSTLQQMVNQLQLERDSLSQELRRSRAFKEPWCGDGPPDVSAILHARSPPRLRGVVESQKLRVARRTRIWFTRRDRTIFASFVARSFTVGFIASGNWGTRCWCAGSSPSDTDVCFDRCRGCQTQTSGWWAWMSSGTFVGLATLISAG